MAHTKSGGSTKLGRESASQRLGIKVNHDQGIKAGQVIVRQRGTKFFPGINVGMGSDDTIFSKINGVVKFEWFKRGKKQVSVYPS